jgi:succinate dehydrogenase / fumarate reductase membrane anchor subunit
MNLVTPLNRVLGLGSAKDGTEHWWRQRVSAVALAVLGLCLALVALGLADWEYATVAAWAQRPTISVLLLISVLTSCYHSQLGVQVVVEDYVHANAVKIATLIVSTFLHVFLAVAGAFAVLKLAFGAPA